MVQIVGVCRMPGLASYGAPLLEGDYSDYTVYDQFADADLSTNMWQDTGIFNKEETKLVICDAFDADGGNIKVYDIASKTLGSSLITYASTRAEPSEVSRKSVQGTYVVIAWASVPGPNINRVSIIKNGVMVKTLTDSDLGILAGYITSAHISRSGKYVLVSGYLSPPIDAWGWVILVGS